jgi:hypothetical protein
LALRFAAEARRKDWVVDDREVADLFADGLHYCLHPPPHRDDVVNCPYFQERDSDIRNLAAIMLTLDPSEIANLSPGERGGGTEAWRKAKRRIALPSPRQLFRLTTVPRTRRAVEKLERAAAGAPRGANALTAAGRIALPPRHDPGGRERA